ncbi:U7 snRNA-associated Sm-like protein LSm11 [Anopheles maculipalpis]|uniref:U7 snRNA-associated Sm-like protein LSm11 n=1 Tax=Anopheles maculipalpis TaxID=1496333 RepID=UPI002158D3D6|nr:U7 snRNA-associated Sm-like protein LSm11 [Anopheles maculipalpis]
MHDSDSESATSDSDSSSELDVGSKRFNPLKALYSAKLKVPVATARLHDNVSVLESKQNTLGGFAEPYDENRVKQIRAAQNANKVKVIPRGQKPERRFLPEQGPVAYVRPLKHTKNLLTRLEKGFEGPLALMQKWMQERRRVRVHIRKQKGIRGHVSGVIELFDKHWNIAISDVCETYTRRKYRYSENNLHPDSIVAPTDCSERLRRLGIVLAKTTVRSEGKKNVIITRKLPQLLIHGIQVVLVTPEPNDPQASTSRAKQ